MLETSRPKQFKQTNYITTLYPSAPCSSQNSQQRNQLFALFLVFALGQPLLDVLAVPRPISDDVLSLGTKELDGAAVGFLE